MKNIYIIEYLITTYPETHKIMIVKAENEKEAFAQMKKHITDIGYNLADIDDVNITKVNTY